MNWNFKGKKKDAREKFEKIYVIEHMKTLLRIAILSIISGFVFVLLMMLVFRFAHHDKIINPEIQFWLAIYGLLVSIAGLICSFLWVKRNFGNWHIRGKSFGILFVLFTAISSLSILLCSMIFGSTASYATIYSKKHNKIFKLIGEFCPTDIVYNLVSSKKAYDLIYEVIGDGQISYSEDNSLISKEELKLSQGEKYLAIFRSGYLTDLYNIQENVIESDSSYLFSTFQDSATWKRLSLRNQKKFSNDN